MKAKKTAKKATCKSKDKVKPVPPLTWCNVMQVVLSTQLRDALERRLMIEAAVGGAFSNPVSSVVAQMLVAMREGKTFCALALPYEPAATDGYTKKA